MILYLAKKCIKNHNDVQSPQVREGYGVLAGIFGVLCNLLLFLIKIAAGILSGSISIIGDAFNNLSDSASSIVTIIGFKISGKAADDEHPFGHGRAEYLAGFIVSFLIILVAVELIRSSIRKIINPEPVTLGLLTLVILTVSILVKILMYLEYQRTAKRIDSTAMQVSATDSLMDCISTSAVLAATIFIMLTGINVDPYLGIVVGLIVIKSGIDSAMDTINPLLGQAPSEDFYKEVANTVLAHEGVIGVHDITVHNYGPGHTLITLDVEIPACGSLVEAHDLLDGIEHEINWKFHCQSVLHMDPVVPDSPRTAQLRAKILKAAASLQIEEEKNKTSGKETSSVNQADAKHQSPAASDITIHDFRLVRHKTRDHLEFDLVIPADFHKTDDAVKKILLQKIQIIEPDLPVHITIDRGASFSHQGFSADDK